MTTAALTVYTMMLFKGERWHAQREDCRKLILFGTATALRFLFSIAFLAFATIAHSLTIAYTAPIFVIPFSAAFLKGPIPGRKKDRIVITVAGCGILAGFQSKSS